MPAAKNSRRPRNAELTRAAILASARKAFVKKGYDGAGVREIAAGAGVTAMLVNRYFGSKEKLFAEVVADTMQPAVILDPVNLKTKDLAKTLAESLVAVTNANATPLDGFLIMARSAASPRAAAITRREIEKHHHATMTNALNGRLTAERAALLLSLVAGVQSMRQVFGLKALTQANPADLAKLLAPMIQAVLAAP
ncbi:MAG: TetR family transcriptional regulator [Terricaulis sp.]